MGKNDTDRGIYRSIYVALWDDEDFQKLPSEARLALLYLRSSPLSNMPCLYRVYREAIEQHTGLRGTVVDRVLDTLSDTGWVEIEKGIIWVKNGLRYDPSISLKNPKHIEAIRKILMGLPKLKIVINFCAYYNIPIPYDTPHDIPSEIGYQKGNRKPNGNPGTGKKEQEQEQDNTPPNPPKGDSMAFVLPDDIDPDIWKAYIEMRKKIKAPLTETAMKLTLDELDKLKRTLGNDKNKVLKQSIQKSWRGVFPLKAEKGDQCAENRESTESSKYSGIGRTVVVGGKPPGGGRDSSAPQE